MAPLPGVGFGAALDLDLGAWLPAPPPALGAFLRRALDDHAVLVFRGSGAPALDAAQLVALHALFEHDADAPPQAYHRGMCRLWRRGLPQVNLLANRAVAGASTAAAGALDDDGEPCVAGKVYGMEAFAWHSDEASRPGGLPVRATAFHADAVPAGADGETHFADARLRGGAAAALAGYDVVYASNAATRDAVLAPFDVAGKRDGFLRPDGFAKRGSAEAAAHAADLLEGCARLGLCEVHASPLVAAHPRTGVPALHLDVKQQLGISGLAFGDAQDLLARVVGAAAAPDRVYRHRWAVGDVVVTDNYAALHTAAPGDAFNDEPRMIARVCLPGGHVPSAPT